MKEKKEEKKELKLIEIQDKVRSLIKFNINSKELKELVNISKKITVPDLEDKEQLKIAKEMKLKLRKFEIKIENKVKNYRSFFNIINKEISQKGSDLKKITTPEIDRISNILKKAEDFEYKKKMMALLPVRKERLFKISNTNDYICEDSALIKMDSNEFERYYNDCVADNNQRIQVKMQEKIDADRRAKQAELDKKQAKLEAREKKIRDEELKKEEIRIANEKKAQEMEQKRRVSLLPERKKNLKEIGDFVSELSDNIILAMDDNEYITYYNNRVAAKNDADAKKIEYERKKNLEKINEAAQKELQEEKNKYEKEKEKILLQKREDYKKWLIDNKYIKGSDIIKEIETGYVMYRKVSVFNK